MSDKLDIIREIRQVMEDPLISNLKRKKNVLELLDSFNVKYEYALFNAEATQREASQNTMDLLEKEV